MTLVGLLEDNADRDGGMSMSYQDWMVLAKTIILIPVVFLTGLYLLEWKGSAKKTHAAIWKKPKRWQLITLCVLWSFIIASLVLLAYIRNSN
jgi:hypothetical protein